MRRMVFREMRLAVRLATQPLANSTRALAMSGLSEMTATPLALTRATVGCVVVATAEQIERVRAFYQRRLAGQVVAWGRTLLYVQTLTTS